MMTANYCTTGFSGVALAIAVGVATIAAGVSPAGALNDKYTFLSGGGTMSEAGDPRFTAPGYTNQLTDTFPGPGLAESATQLKMQAGTLSKLRVKLTTATAPSSGKLKVIVRINGSNTALRCTLSGTGSCSSGNKSVSITNKSKLSVLVSNDFVGSGNLSYTYTLLYD